MNADFLTFTLDLQLSREKVEQAMQLLVSGIGRIEAKSGCQNCYISRDVSAENRLHYSESWAAENEFRQHVRSEEFLRVLTAMDMCSEEPSVVIGNFSGHTGLTYLQELCDRREAG